MVDPQLDVGTPQTECTEKTECASEGGVTSVDDQASLKSEGLKLEPQLERILTPPPAFWSPPPNSTVIRTSAPLPLLPAANVSTPTARATSVSIPSARTSSAPPLRPMSVPPPGDSLRVGESEDVRRAWSCQPATAELPPVKSFAGDWRQCMVIELSDEEEEEEETTDTDFSELEDEEVDDCQVLDATDVAADGDLMTLPELKSKSVGGAEMGSANQDKPAESREMTKGVVTPGIGSGVNAVEAVQHAIVKLALDNAGAVHSQRAMQARPKRPAAPIRTGSMTGIYPTMNQPFTRRSLDSEHYRDSNPLRVLQSQYSTTAPRPSHIHNLPVYPHLSANPTLESLRSGLELRAAASASAIEEAVRARSASPGVTPQDGHGPGSRSNPGFILPPRLQRLQSVHPRTTAPIPTPRLEIPSLPSPRLDIPALQQRRSPYESPLRSAPPVANLYPAPFNAPQYPVMTRQFPIIPLVQASAYSEALRLPRGAAIFNRAHLTSIFDNKPVPPAPATAPLPRNNSGRYKLAAPIPSPEPIASAETPTTQSSTSSPMPKQKGGKKRWHKHRKNPTSEQAKAGTPTSSTSGVPSKPKECANTPKESVPTPKKPSPSPPKKSSASVSKSDSPHMANETPSSASKPKRKHKSPKRHKPAKSCAVPTAVPAVST
ncbi:WNK lysine deficient protein kinase 2 [Rhizoctonia solani]|uniref:WNK lysine deficient protein kinase 2 n=1 Tax=Rhizoctonia solani TaxID=456999 RepID=A0A8H8T0W6_9AGAM|nr:WNK lysine deficient protein kinase 2 [Rhizoctonia solani]QRW23893.1 WNK lysine deficient protein kinase 2 [Rhizoctonia solani]